MDRHGRKFTLPERRGYRPSADGPNRFNLCVPSGENKITAGQQNAYARCDGAGALSGEILCVLREKKAYDILP